MNWCETHEVDYVLGLAKNSRLKTAIENEMTQAKDRYATTQQFARVFRDFRYRTHKSWSCERRVIGKVEYMAKGENLRFIVASLPVNTHDARALYEDLYCARGDMENRIKEQQLALFADRSSTHQMRSNQLRLYFASFAYVLMQTLRRLDLQCISMVNAQGTPGLDRFFRELPAGRVVPSRPLQTAAYTLALLIHYPLVGFAQRRLLIKPRDCFVWHLKSLENESIH